MSSMPTQADVSEEKFITVTPAGSYYAIENKTLTDSRLFLHQLLANSVTPRLSDYQDANLEIIKELRKAGLVTLGAPEKSLPQGNLSDLLPDLLPALSERARVVLAESRQGFYLDFTGVSPYEAEELAVMASSLRAVSDTRSTLLSRQLSITGSAFGIVDPAGNSEIGFWPLHIADNVFTLIILGIPRFNSVQFSTLVWALIQRYGPNNQT